MERAQMRDAGGTHRRQWAEVQAMFQKQNQPKPAPKPVAIEESGAELLNPVRPAAATEEKRPDPFAARQVPFSQPENVFDPAREQHTGIVLGIAMASYRVPAGRKANVGEESGAAGAASGAYEEGFVVIPGDDVKITIPTAGQPPKIVSDDFTVVDFYESKMAEYDSSFVFVPLRKLQEMRGMIDPVTGVGMINSIQIKLKPGVDGNEVRDKLRDAKDDSGRLIFPPQLYQVATWRDKQGALLAAVQMETAVLNILLFLIIAVAGFGILAIFYMIVVEKTRDIGILKSLGASGRGVMGIFLAYGLSLGVVGSGVGMIAGLLFVRYINQIADFVGWILHRPLFNPEIYYFYKIPTIVFPATVMWIVTGALAIAVLASVLPARRAARLHPVQALRYE
jgi:lipoprotein-releasing system permease protein